MDYLWQALPDTERRSLVGQQMAHEEDMLTRQHERYVNQLGYNPDEAKPESDLLADVRSQLGPVYQRWIDETTQIKPDGKRLRFPRWLPPLCEIGASNMADITIRTIITILFAHRGDLDRYDVGDRYPMPTAQSISLLIADNVLTILRYRNARVEYRDNWRKQNHFYKTWTPRRCKAFAEKVAEAVDMDWNAKCDFGHHMLRIAQASGVVKFVNLRKLENGRFREISYVTLSDEVMLHLLKSHEDIIDGLLPYYRPMICRPTQHTVWETGGAASPWIRKASVRTHVITEKGEKPKTSMSEMECTALNALQNVEWTINDRVLDVIKTMFKSNHGQAGLPTYEEIEFTMGERYPKDEDRAIQRTWLKKRDAAKAVWYLDRQKRYALMTRLSEASRLVGRTFWHAWFCDFRSRKYTATEVLSPQGNDWDRGLLKFAKSRKQTKDGLYWLKVHVANLWDQDKDPFDDRVAWVDRNMAMLRAINDDPIANRGAWVSDKKKKNPSFQRLAAAFDLIKSIDQGITELPVQLDGSCNGAQHWAAIMRDEELAMIVNLVKRERPGDLYQVVADKSTEICKSAPNDWRERFMVQWNSRIDRAVTKRPTMCDPYGISLYGIKVYCRTEGHLDWVPVDLINTASRELAMVIDQALKGTLILPNKGKDWLKAATKISSMRGTQVEWITPTGFHVHHHYYKTKDRLSWTTLFTKKSPRSLVFGRQDPTTLHKEDAVLGISPNFTHSVDAAHMTFVIMACLAAGVTQFSMIHDSYGVPAPDVAILRSAIVEQFVHVHKQDPLNMFKMHMEKVLGQQLPDLPDRGSFDIDQVLDANYTFG